ncbi:spermidine/putrescine ABC transporter permease [Bryobacterales bacterium F-183]|nr:spermidine/putrescine ABC transporter permease [Bryobacterales bacterium F-183]
MHKLRAWFLLPARLVNFVCFVVPLCIVLAYSLLSRGVYGGVEQPWTFENYRRLVDPLYLGIFLRSFWIAGLATLLCLVLGFPLAWFIARSSVRRRTLYLNLVMIPFWTSFLVRTYAWMFLLRDTGLINTVLLATGIIAEPLPLLYNNGAVLLGLVYGYLPFLVLPVYTSLEKIDLSMMEAAADLGARPITAFWQVVVPMAKPGMRAGSILVFISCIGTYLTPDLLGGSKTIMIGNVVQNQFTAARDWPFGAACSLLLMGLVMLFLRSDEL